MIFKVIFILGLHTLKGVDDFILEREFICSTLSCPDFQKHLTEINVEYPI